jgi:hypothetical protein
LLLLLLPLLLLQLWDPCQPASHSSNSCMLTLLWLLLTR